LKTDITVSGGIVATRYGGSLIITTTKLLLVCQW